MHEICSNMQYQICRNIHKKENMKYAIYVHNKHKYDKICKTKICTYMQKYHMHKYAQKGTKMQNQTCINMHFQNMHKYVFNFSVLKYALYAEICIRINMPLLVYANLNVHKYAQNVHKYANICSDPISISPALHSYSQNMQKYSRYVIMKVLCKICKNMHSPLC